MGVKLGFLLKTILDQTNGYLKVPSFVGGIFKAAGAPFLSKSDISNSYKIVSNTVGRVTNAHMVEGIQEPYKIIPVMRYLMKNVPEDSTDALFTLFGLLDDGEKQYQPLMYALAQQFFRCVFAKDNEASNIIGESYADAISNPELMFDDSNPNIASIFLTEVDNCCPICGKHKQLVDCLGGFSKNYNIVKIYPDYLTHAEEIEYSKISPKPENLDSPENKIALCNECATKYNYTDRGNIDSFKKLLEIKKKLIAKNEERRELNSAQLLPKIKDVVKIIRTGDILKDFKVDETVDSSLTYDPANVRDKIKDDDLLFNEVNIYAVKYYPPLSEFFRLLDKNNEGTFEDICYQIRKIYRTLKNKGHTQSYIYQNIADFINERTFNDKDYDTACRIVVAFFIQDCEVFEK